MRKYYGVTAPVWIFLFTLFLVIMTGGIVGSSPCERTVKSCETTAVKAHTNNLTLQQAYISRCSESACKSSKSGAAVPFSILILGVVLYVVWLRQGETRGSGPAPATRSAPGTQARTAAPETPKRPSPSTPRAVKEPASPPKTAKAKPKTGAASSKDEGALSAAENTLYLGALEANEEQSKDDLAQGLGKLTGNPDAEIWKSAPSGDLVLLTHVLATAAILGGKSSKYRKGGSSSSVDLDAMTKKALHQQCIDTLRSDLADLAKGAYPTGLSKESVEATQGALNAEGALSGLSRLSKAALVTLAGFLGSS